MYQFRALLIISLISLCFVLHAEETAIVQTDYARFRGTATETNVEIFYNINPLKWELFSTAAADSVCSLVIDFTLEKEDAPIDQKRWRMLFSKKDTSWQQQNRIDLLRYTLVPGDYQARIRVTDPSGTHADSVVMPIRNEAIAGDALALSDLVLCTKIQNADASSSPVLIKNNIEVTPNIARYYSEASSMLWFYVELYNLAENIAHHHYQILYWLGDDNGYKIEKIPEKKRLRPRSGDTMIEVGWVPLTPLPSGWYWLYFAVADSGETRVTYTRKRFYFSHPSYTPTESESDPETARGVAFYEALDSVQVAREIRYIHYLADRETQKLLAQLNTTRAMRSFLSMFWRLRDPDPGTPLNEFRQEYLQRAEYANSNFREGSAGWKTDRGRAAMLYGIPSDIDRYPSSSTGRGYQIWTYDAIQGGVNFVFIDLKNQGTYTLVHSTMRGENYNPNWQELLEIHRGISNVE